MDEALPPYARLLGLRTERVEDGTLLWIMPFEEAVVGRPGYLHGGAIAGLLEIAAFGTLYDALGRDAQVSAKPINVSIDFIRGGKAHETTASAEITRLGKRVASVQAHTWQQDTAKQIASAHMNLLLKLPQAD